MTSQHAVFLTVVAVGAFVFSLPTRALRHMASSMRPLQSPVLVFPVTPHSMGGLTFSEAILPLPTSAESESASA